MPVSHPHLSPPPLYRTWTGNFCALTGTFPDVFSPTHFPVLNQAYWDGNGFSVSPLDACPSHTRARPRALTHNTPLLYSTLVLTASIECAEPTLLCMMWFRAEQGTLPASIGSISSMETMSFNVNNFGGPFPKAFCETKAQVSVCRTPPFPTHSLIQNRQVRAGTGLPHWCRRRP